VGRGPGASWPGFERLAGARKHKFTPIPTGKLRELFPAASMYSDKSSLTEMGFGRGVPGDVGEEGGTHLRPRQRWFVSIQAFAIKSKSEYLSPSYLVHPRMAWAYLQNSLMMMAPSFGVPADIATQPTPCMRYSTSHRRHGGRGATD